MSEESTKPAKEQAEPLRSEQPDQEKPTVVPDRESKSTFPSQPLQLEPGEDEQATVIRAPHEAPVARAAKSMPKEAPTKEEFKIQHPRLSALDSDIIRLTAQYTAVSGKPFLSGLATREQRNPQFDFLKPTHALFAYFTTLVESYAKILVKKGREQATKLQERLDQGKSRMDVLDRCVHRLEWNRIEEEKILKEQAQDDENRVYFQHIDWHDFIVVESITFESSAPTSALGGDTTEQLQTSSNNQKEPDEDMDMDMEEDSDSDSDSDDNLPTEPQDEEGPMEIVQNYVPQAMGATAPGAATTVMTADGQVVANDQVNEHMRILLMDPKWREENQRRLDKQKETSFAGGESIADSLRRFADKRSDIFASSAEEEARLRAKQQELESSNNNGQREYREEEEEEIQPQAQMQQPHEEYHHPMPPVSYAQGGPPPPVYPLQHYTTSGPPGSVLLPPSYGPPGNDMGGNIQNNNSAGPNAMMPGPPGSIGNVHPSRMMNMMNLPPQVQQPQVIFGQQPPCLPGLSMPDPSTGPPGVASGPPGVASGPPGVASGPPGVAPTFVGNINAPINHNSEDQPHPAKRARIEGVGGLALISEAEFAAAHPGLIRLFISIPQDESSTREWKLDGQTIALEADVMCTIKQLKSQISMQLGNIPPNKFQLKAPVIGFVKDTLSIAHYNFDHDFVLSLHLRQRGGRR